MTGEFAREYCQECEAARCPHGACIECDGCKECNKVVSDDYGEEVHAPIPDCYGCLGTGTLQGFGSKPGVPCPCLTAKEG
jgi:hypothetical protein